ncbi:hypothetical protein Desaci_4067 [Desulfosporosinus acidiphilus SJ4]|uniref:Uncharacterized protein n=2 Tax=Desulfosporosinus TaxID=79206 RepID=I4DAV6_DESAJ|nr:hypothetical protein Desaci_4067 [Desulfosporosinus acidiphilus SJ4]
MQWQEPPSIDLDATIDAHVIGRVTVIQFVIVVIITIPSIFLSFIVLQLPFFIASFVTLLLPAGTFFFFYNDGPRELKILSGYYKRKRTPEAGYSMPGAYDFESFGTMNPLVAVPDYVLVHATITLQPVSLLGESEESRLKIALERLTRAAAKANVLLDWFMSHELYRPIVPPESNSLLQDRNRYWMETGTHRFQTPLVIRLAAKTQDLDEAWRIAEQVRRGYESAGGEGWEWASCQLIGQMTIDQLDPGAAWRRYVNQFNTSNSNPADKRKEGMG